MRRELTVGVEAQRRVGDLHAGEVVGAFLQVADLCLAHTLLDLDRGERVASVATERPADVDCRHVQDAPERAELAQPCGSILREVRLPDHDGRPGHVRDEHLPVAVEDRATGRFLAYFAPLVVLRGTEQLLAVQDL